MEREEAAPLMVLIHQRDPAPAIVTKPSHNQNTDSFLKKVICGTEIQALCFLLDL
jgi:hypothetical protein